MMHSSHKAYARPFYSHRTALKSGVLSLVLIVTLTDCTSIRPSSSSRWEQVYVVQSASSSKSNMFCIDDDAPSPC